MVGCALEVEPLESAHLPSSPEVDAGSNERDAHTGTAGNGVPDAGAPHDAAPPITGGDAGPHPLDAASDGASAVSDASAGHADGAVDAGANDGLDAGVDAGGDAGQDAGHDAGQDAGDDSGVDAGADAGPDAAADAGVDAGEDAGEDAGNDGGNDAGRDATVDCDPPPPCVCPDEPAEPDERGCVPERCRPDLCAPDDDCEFHGTATSAYYLCRQERDWHDARVQCNTRAYTRLASIEDEDEDDFLLELVGGLDKVWVSGNDLEDEGSFFWATGQHFFERNQANGGPVDGAYVNFAAGEPNNQGVGFNTQGDCIILWTEQGRRVWADANCDDEHAFICEVVVE